MCSHIFYGDASTSAMVMQKNCQKAAMNNVKLWVHTDLLPCASFHTVSTLINVAKN